MRLFIGLFVSVFFVSPAVLANEGQAFAILQDVRVDGVGLMSTPQEIQAVMDGYGSVSVNCEHMRNPQQVDKRQRVRPHYERWSCLSQTTKTPGVWKRLSVTYAHNRVVSIDYEGSVMPDLGGQGVVDYVAGLNDRFVTLSGLGDAYSYKGFDEVVGASSQYLTQSLGLNLKKTCRRYDDYEIGYQAGMSLSYSEIPSQNSQSVKFKLSQDEHNQCFQIVDVLK